MIASVPCGFARAGRAGARSLQAGGGATDVVPVPAAHGDPERGPDQLGVLELDARSLVTVVEKDIESGSLKIRGDALAC